MTQTTTATRTHIAYFDTLRAIAIVAVIVLHVAAWDWSRATPNSAPWEILNAFDSAVRFCVPIFFMISGALFLDPARTVTTASIFRKSLLRLAIPFVVWSLFYAVFSFFGPTPITGAGQFLYLFGIGYYHLWFLLALGGLYLVTPFLRPIVADRKNAWYFVTLAAVFALILPLLTQLPVIGKLFATLTDKMQLHLVLGYSLYFVLGYLLHTAKLTRKAVIWVAIAGGVGIVVTWAATSLLTASTGVADSKYYGYLTPNVVIASIAVFVVVRYLSERGGVSRAVPRPVSILSTYSLGIYLVHPLFQTLGQWIGYTGGSGNPLLMVPLVALSILVPSLLVAMVLRLIPRFGKYLG